MLLTPRHLKFIAFFFVDGNGFKTSTMRLGADVIVFSRCPGKDGDRLVGFNDFTGICIVY